MIPSHLHPSSRTQTKNSQSILANNNNNTHLNYASAYSSARYTTNGEHSVMSLTSLMQQHGIDSGMFRPSPAISAQRNLPLPANNENLERSNNFRHENSSLALQDRSNSTPHMQSSHHLINKAYKAIRSSRRQESGRDILLPTAQTVINPQPIIEDPQQGLTSESNISSLNNTEERPMKRRICFKSKSANKLSQKPTNFNAQDFLNELENIRSGTNNQPPVTQEFIHCSPNESQPISRQEQEETYQRSHPERTPSPHRNLQEYNTQSSGKSNGPAVKHRVLLQSSANKNKRDTSYDSLPSAPSAQKQQQHYYGLRAVSPPPNHLQSQRTNSPFQDLRSRSPLEKEPSPGGKYSNRSGVYTQILSKHYDLSDIKSRFQGSNSKRMLSSSPSPNDKRRPMQNYEQPTLSQVQRINFSHLNSAGKSSLMSYTDDEERREDRLIPIQHAHAVKKQEEYRRDAAPLHKTPTKNLTSSTKSVGVNVGDFNIDTRQLLLSVEKKASTLSLEDLAKKRSRSSSPLQKLSSSYNSNNILRESNAYQQETCNSVLSDINLKIEGILQKCCELTEKSAKGLEKLNSSRSFRKASTATMERGGSLEPVVHTANTANTVNTQDTGRGDTGRELIRLTSEESTADFRKPEKNYWSAASIENGGNNSQRVLTEEQQGKEFEDVLAEDRILNRAGLGQRRHGETIIEEEEEASKDMMYFESQQKLDQQETRYNSSPVHNNSQQNEGVYSVYSDIIVKEPESIWNTSSGLGQLIFTSEQGSHLMSFGSVKKNHPSNFRSKNADYLSSHIYTSEVSSKEGVKPATEIAVKVEAAMSSANSLQAQVNAREDSHFPTGHSESLTKEKLEKEISTAVHELESISKVLKTLPSNSNNNEQLVSAVGLEQVQAALMQKIGAIHEDILTRIEQLNQKIESKSALSTRRKSSAAASHVSNEPVTKPNTKTEVDNTKIQSMNISDFEAIHGHQSFLNQSSLPKPDSARSTIYVQSQTLNHSTHQDQAKAFEPVLTFGSIKGPYSSKEDVKKLQKSKSQHKYEPKQVNISIPKIMEHATSRSTTKTNRREVDHMAVFKDVSPISHKNDMLKGSLFEDVSLIGRSGRSTEKGSISNIKRDASTNTEKTVESLPINDETPNNKPMAQVQMFGRKNETTKKPKTRDMGERKWSNDKLRNGFSKYMKTIYGEDHFNDTVSLVVQTEPGYDEMNGKLTSVYEERYLNLLNRELRQKNLKRYNMDNSDYHDLAFEKQILAAKYHTFAQNEEKESSQPEQQSPSPEHTIKSEGIPSEKKKLAVDLMSLSSLRRNRDLETPDENIQKLEEWLDVHVPGGQNQQYNPRQKQQQQQNSSSASSKTKTNSNSAHKLKVLKIQNLIKQAQGKPVKDEQHHHQGSLFYTEGNEVEEDFSWLDASASQSRINRSSVLSTKLSNYDPNRSNSRDNGRLSVKSSQGKSVNRNVSSVKKGETSSTKKNTSAQKSTTDRRNLLKNVYLESLGSVSSFEVGRENRGGMYESKIQSSSKKTSTPEKKVASSAKKVVGKSGEKKRFEERISEDRIKNFGMVRKY